VRHCFSHYTSGQVTFWLLRETQYPRSCHADIRVANRQVIDVPGFEIRPYGCGEVQRIPSTETTVHALALPKHCVSYFHRAVRWLFAAGRPRTEIHDYCWVRRDGFSSQAQHGEW